MNELKAAFLLELRSVYGLNKVRYTKDKREKNRYKLLAVAFAVLAAAVFSYVAGIVYALDSLGVGEMTVQYLFFLSSILVFAVGIFKSGAALFSKKGYDILSSMPMKTSSIVSSRAAVLWLEGFFLTLAVFIPGAVADAVLMRSFSDIAVLLLSAVFVPMLPISCSVLLSTLLMLAVSKMKHKSIAYSALSVAFVILVLGFSVTVPQYGGAVDGDALKTLFLSAAGMMGKFYPPTEWIAHAADGELLFAALYASLSVLSLFAAAAISVLLYHPIIRLSQTNTAKHNYILGRQKSGGVMHALVKRELRRYFSSGVYVTNTILGPIMGVVISVSLAFVGTDMIAGFLPAELSITEAIPFFIAGVFTLMTTTSVSVSMEGSRFYIVKSLPLTSKEILDGKIVFSLLLSAPFYIVSVIFTLIATKPSFSDALFTLAVPAVIIVFASVLGITVNLKLYNFAWENEVAVVKQSASAAIGGFAGPLLSFALGAAGMFLGGTVSIVFRLISVVLIISLTAWLYSYNNKTDLGRLE